MANEHIINNDVQISGSLNVSQSISASAFYGDGSGLLYVTASSQWNGILTGSADITGQSKATDGREKADADADRETGRDFSRLSFECG